MKTILWMLFVLVVVILGFHTHGLKLSGYSIVDLELADRNFGLLILDKWQRFNYGDLTLIDIARSHTQWDFFFIVVYVVLLMTMSNWQMQRERWMPLNELLRLNLFIVFIAGILDIIENFIILHNFHHIYDAGEYMETNLLSWIKFCLIGFALLVFFISLLNSLIFKLK